MVIIFLWEGNYVRLGGLWKRQKALTWYFLAFVNSAQCSSGWHSGFDLITTVEKQSKYKTEEWLTAKITRIITNGKSVSSVSVSPEAFRLERTTCSPRRQIAKYLDLATQLEGEWKVAPICFNMHHPFLKCCNKKCSALMNATILHPRGLRASHEAEPKHARAIRRYTVAPLLKCRQYSFIKGALSCLMGNYHQQCRQKDIYFLQLCQFEGLSVFQE